jgi:Plasmid pRiA4b ORF-3-like protein
MGAIYQLKITLEGIEPPVWRRVQVSGDIPLARLHKIIQAVMGWEDYHLYEFEVQRVRYSAPGEDFGFDTEQKPVNVNRATLEQAVEGRRIKFRYWYDFGDDWFHEIKVEKILEPEAGAAYPRCVEGGRACPPEDCGGVWGYSNLLEILADPGHEEHEHYLEWLGGPFDSEAFDLDAVNRELKRRFQRKTTGTKKS